MSQVPQPKSVFLVRKSTPVADDTLARQLTALLDVAEKDANKNGRDGSMTVLGVEGGEVVVFEVEVRPPSVFWPEDMKTVEQLRQLFVDQIKSKVLHALDTAEADVGQA